jgi:pimeloyl-ACP methyl ester carboxylesterase
MALLESIAAPTLVVAGDRGLRLQDEQERMNKIRDYRFVELDDVGHMIHWFAPRRLSTELHRFFVERGP